MVVFGASSFIDHAFHEHRSEDIHDHGVVGGVLHGTGHVASETYDDGKRLLGDGKKLLKDCWGGIKSVF
ncbi:hypothetical protein [Streptomyces broussonetiae]|uniref:hypothetical protein n=1 Tax=Streptomyces broussonetiae TaxID=2686304 RepID=UPI0035DC429B